MTISTVVRIQRRRGTAAQWTSANPTLLAGEEGFETDTGKVKIGDGVTAWAALKYRWPFDPSSVAITGGVIGGMPVTGLGSFRTWRQVATRSSLCNSFNSANKQTMSRSAHWMRTAVSSLKLVYGNWRCDFNAGEVGTGTPVTYTSAIEYPLGTFTRVTFNGGQASISIADLATAVSDEIAIAIPKNAKFFVRTWCSGTGGILYNGKVSTTHGEAMTFGATGVVDQTLGGTVADSSGAGIVTPYAIVGLSSAPAPYLLGDSRVFGQLDAFTSCVYNDSGEMARSLGPFMGYINGGIPSESANHLATASTWMTQRIALAQSYCTHVLCNLGINDVNLLSRTGAQAFADLQTVWAYFGDMPILQSTVAPVSTSTDSWATTANQTTAGSNTNRVALNASIRATGLVAGVIELADVVESGRDSGLWAVPGYTTDGIHESQKANLAIQYSAKLLPGRLSW